MAAEQHFWSPALGCTILNCQSANPLVDFIELRPSRLLLRAAFPSLNGGKHSSVRAKYLDAADKHLTLL
jgi:hypothetical protein